MQTVETTRPVLDKHALGWQFGEAGVIRVLADTLGLSGTVVECGGGDPRHGMGMTCELLIGRNPIVLYEADADAARACHEKWPEVGTVCRRVSADDPVTGDCDVLVVDLDGQEINARDWFDVDPVVLCVEHYDTHGPELPEDWLWKLGQSHETYCVQAPASEIEAAWSYWRRGYSLVWTSRINSIFVRNDRLEELEQVPDDGKVRLNLGAGFKPMPGFISVDRKIGTEVYPLAWPDASVDELYASHILEHFPFKDLVPVVREWVRVLKPGGRLRVAVPDFNKIIEMYRTGDSSPAASYLMGGQNNPDDFHRSVFDEMGLRSLMRAAGLVCVGEFAPVIDDCASLAVSLNLEGYKPLPPSGPLHERIHCVMSVPRLGFMDNFFCLHEALVPKGIRVTKFTGAYWGECLERVIEDAVAQGCEWVLTVDYDTVFTPDTLDRLLMLAEMRPDADAIAPLQVKRESDTVIAARKADTLASEFEQDLMEVDTAHFGLTMLRASAFAKMSKPWFQSVPNSKGHWRNEGDDCKVDADINFWHQWRAAGNTLYLAPRVSVGHMELMVTWPGEDFKPLYQRTSEYQVTKQPPKGVRQ